MWIDLSFIAFSAVAFFLGFRKGFIHSLLSVLAFFAGLVAALKFSHHISVYVERWLKVSGDLVPVVSFALLFAGVIAGMWFLSKVIEGLVNMTGLGIVNKIAGGTVWLVVSVFVFSTLLFYVSRAGKIPESWKSGSKTFSHLEPAAPLVLEQMGKALPFLEGTFDQVASHFKSSQPDDVLPDER